jgi:hypothetical protein
MQIDHESLTPSKNRLKNFEPGMCVRWQNKYYIVTAHLTGVNLENGATLDGDALVEVVLGSRVIVSP